MIFVPKIRKFVYMLIFLILFMIVSCVVLACTNDDYQKNNQYLKISTNATEYPFAFKENAELRGVEIDIAKSFFQKSGREELQISDLDSAKQAIDSVANGNTDIAIARLTRNNQYEELVDFSNTYFDARQTIIVKSTNKEFDFFDGLPDNDVTLQTAIKFLKTVNIGVIDGSQGYDFVKNKLDFTDKTFIYNSIDKLLKSLDNGEIDCIIIDNHFAANLSKNNYKIEVNVVEIFLTQQHYVVAVKKGNNDLRVLLNDWILSLTDQSSGISELDKIVLNYC